MPIQSGQKGLLGFISLPKSAGLDVNGGISNVYSVKGVKGVKGGTVTGESGLRYFKSTVFGTASLNITGITKDSTGAALGSCVVELYVTSSDRVVGRTTSDATTGAYTFNITFSGPFYIVAYKAGAPDVAGTTVNTLVGA